MEAQDYKKLIEALRLCQFGECGCGKCYYKELKGDWCTEDNHPEFFDCDDKLKLDAANAIEELQAEVKRLEPKRGEWVYEELDNFRKYKVTCPHCGEWYIGNYDAYDEPSDFNYCPHCGNICNPQNIEWEKMQAERAKMEVQDGK